MVDDISMEYNISIKRCCNVVLLSKSVYYYKHKGLNYKLLRMSIMEFAATRVRYGFYRIYFLLRRECFMDNHKRAYRVYYEEVMNFRGKRLKRNRTAANKQPNDGASSTFHEFWSIFCIRPTIRWH